MSHCVVCVSLHIEMLNFLSYLMSLCSCWDDHYYFHIKTMFCSYFIPICLWEGSCLIYVICVCLRIVVSNSYCAAVFLFCLSSVCVLCTKCCQFLWIIYFWLPFQYFLTFIYLIFLSVLINSKTLENQTWPWNERINSIFLYDSYLKCAWFIFACFALFISFFLFRFRWQFTWKPITAAATKIN